MAEPKKKADETKDKAETKTKKDAKPKTKAKPKADAKKKADAKAKPKAAPRKPAAKGKTAAKGRSEAKPKAEPKKPAKPVAPPTVHASARFVRIAPRKVRQIADQIRGLGIDDARSLLQFSSRGAARDVSKLLESAAANAENNHDLVADDLMISEIFVNEGPTLRRYRPRALGRATPINKRTSHISVALKPEEVD